MTTKLLCRYGKILRSQSRFCFVYSRIRISSELFLRIEMFSFCLQDEPIATEFVKNNNTNYFCCSTVVIVTELHIPNNGVAHCPLRTEAIVWNHSSLYRTPL